MAGQKRIGIILSAVSVMLLVLLFFSKVDNDKKDVYLCEATAANPELEMSDCPAHNSNSSWILTFSFGLAFTLLAIGAFLIFSKERKELLAEKKETKGSIKRTFSDVDMSKLDEAEKKVYNILRVNNGSVYQSALVKETGFSKVKVTRILDKMHSAGIIERQRRGMTNIVVLK